MEDNTNAADKPPLNHASLQNNPFSNLIAWSQASFSDLPWRQNRTFYATLISEFMLQQTTVSGVWEKFTHFMQTYPSWEVLRTASLEDLLHAWKGLGYYQRPKSLYKLLQIYSSLEDLIADMENEVKQPGIGPYTQGALLSIGLDREATALDANIRRVLSRYFNTSESQLLAPYHQLLSEVSPRALNEALMDLGREVCQARKADCAKCLLQRHCKSALTIQNTLIKQKVSSFAKERIDLDLIRLVITTSEGSIIGWKKPEGSWLAGYIELPTFVLPSLQSDLTMFKQYPRMNEVHLLEISQKRSVLMSNTITKYRLRSKIFKLSLQKCSVGLQQWLEETIPDMRLFLKNALWAKSSIGAIEALEALNAPMVETSNQ